MSDHLNLFFCYLFINGPKRSFKILILLVCNILNHLLTYTSRSLFSIEERHFFLNLYFHPVKMRVQTSIVSIFYHNNLRQFRALWPLPTTTTVQQSAAASQNASSLRPSCPSHGCQTRAFSKGRHQSRGSRIFFRGRSRNVAQKLRVVCKKKQKNILIMMSSLVKMYYGQTYYLILQIQLQ